MAEVGAPTKRTPERLHTIKEALGLGLDYGTAARLAGIHPDTLRVWRKDDPEFSAQLEQARSQPLMTAAQVIQKAITNDDDPREATAAAFKFLRARSDEFRDKVDVSATVEEKKSPVLIADPAKSASDWDAENRVSGSLN